MQEKPPKRDLRLETVRREREASNRSKEFGREIEIASEHVVVFCFESLRAVKSVEYFNIYGDACRHFGVG